jgi:Transposase
MLYAGLDLSRKRLDFHLLDGEGATVERGATPPDADGLERLSERVARHGAPIRAAIESMNGARFVHDRLELAGWQVEIADAQKAKGLAPLACKTDRIDAWVLAELARRDLVPAIWLPDPLVRAEREVGARREADEVRVAVRSERHPRIGRAVVIAPVRGGAARARAEVRPRLAPGLAAVVGDRGDDPVRAAVVPAVLLEDADDVVRVRRTDRDERLDLGVRIVRTRPADRAPGERARLRSEDERSLRVRAAGRRRDDDERGRCGCKDGSPERPSTCMRLPLCLATGDAPAPPSWT